MKVSLKGVTLEWRRPEGNNFGIAGTEWAAWFYLNLFDDERKVDIPEWFYLAACSLEFYNRTAVKHDSNHTYAYLVQTSFDPEQIEAEARDRFHALSFDDWDHFYEAMASVFYYEDEADLCKPQRKPDI